MMRNVSLKSCHIHCHLETFLQHEHQVTVEVLFRDKGFAMTIMLLLRMMSVMTYYDLQ